MDASKSKKIYAIKQKETQEKEKGKQRQGGREYYEDIPKLLECIQQARA